LAQMEAIASVAVFGVADAKWGEVPRAAIVVREGYELSEQDVLSYLDGKLARYKIPKSAVFVDDMPRTASGKVRKPQLRELYGHQRVGNLASTGQISIKPGTSPAGPQAPLE